MMPKLDPRAKLLLLLLCALAVFFSPGQWFEAALMLLIAAYGVLAGYWRISLIMVVIYACALGAVGALASADIGGLSSVMTAFFQLVRKVFPCALLAAIIVASTHVNEFMTAMNRLRLPRAITIPLAVMLRYVPAIREDWGYIQDAMRMRGVSPSIKGLLAHPGRTIECVYVPLMMSASNVADELSCAAVARGIENPAPRTCYRPIEWRLCDTMAAFVGLAVLAAAILLTISGVR